MPRPESLTIEGLMGEHDLEPADGRACDQLFCLATEAMPAALPARPDDRLFVGLGFTSNIDAASWRREPLNLVAVVDKSGSMSGPPLDLVRRSLRQIVGQMRDGDQLSIVLYGDTSARLSAADRRRAATATRCSPRSTAIESAGSTNMEAGLKVGYETAFATAPAFRGNTRVMLFTDEQPNVGAHRRRQLHGHGAGRLAARHRPHHDRRRRAVRRRARHPRVERARRQPLLHLQRGARCEACSTSSSTRW